MGVTNSNVVETPDENLESFSIIWLDVLVNKTKDNQNAQKKLRQIINHLRIFEDQNECHQYISSMSPQERLILIISGRCGRQLVPQIHDLQQLSSVYVYCLKKEENEEWTKYFTKVKSVAVGLDELIKKIKQDQQSRMKIEEPLAINILNVNDNPDRSTTGLNSHFVHSFPLIDVLIRMQPNETDKQELITLCKKYYENNDQQFALVKEFELEYSADGAISWFTRDSFLFNILNKALRVQNIDLLFLFRFFISDIYAKLKEKQCQEPVHVFRGQVMSTDELNNLRGSVGGFISINSFFSTSLDRGIAMKFLEKPVITTDLHRVLFDINADPDVVRSKPFADITSLSYFQKELEILFMTGCVFRLIGIHPDDNDEQFSVIQMELYNDDEHDLKKISDHMIEEYGGNNRAANLQFLGHILREMRKYGPAEKMYRRLLYELPADDRLVPQLCYSLGLVAADKGDDDASLQHFNESLEINMRTDPSDYDSISGTYTGIGIVYQGKGDNKTALEYYNKAITLLQEAHNDNHPTMASLYNNIAIIYRQQKKYSEALENCKKSLNIYVKHLPPDHPDIATSHNNIGSIHRDLGQYYLAKQHHEQALKSYLKSLPSQHRDIAMTYANIRLVYERKGEWKQALVYYQDAANIYRHSLPPQHPDVSGIETMIQRVSSKFN